MELMSKDYIAGSLDNIKFVAMECQYQGKWVMCFNSYRAKWEMPGGHVDEGETPLEAAKRELFEETGAIKFDIIPVWDYKAYTDEGEFHNNGRVYYVTVHEFGILPEISEMDRIDFFEELPQNITYKRETMLDLMTRAKAYSRAFYE